MAPPKRPWFRFYTEAAGDRKLRRLAPAERWLWVAVLSAARESPVPGVMLITETEPMTVEDLADYAGMKEHDVKAGLAKMNDLGLIYDRTDGAVVVSKWDARQPESDDVTARTRRHRSNDKPPDDDGTTMERSIVVPWNGDTPPDGTPLGRSRERSSPVRRNDDGTRQKTEEEKRLSKESLSKTYTNARADRRQTRRSAAPAEPETDLDSPNGSDETRANRAIDWLAGQRTDAATGVRSRARYRAGVAEDLRGEHWDDAIANARQGWTARDIAARIENPSHRPQRRAAGDAA